MYNSAMPVTAMPQPAKSGPDALRAPSTAQSKYPVDHLFANNVRFLSMAGVVACHCIFGFGLMSGINSSGTLFIGMVQPFKFATIGFFLISGFLMNEGLTRRDPLDYLKRRLQRVFAPWLLWFSLLFAMMVAGQVVRGKLDLLSLGDSLPLLFHSFRYCLFSTAYWFVPNLLIALCVLLLCRRILSDMRFGCLLLTFSLFYGLNVYAQWLPVESHTEALLGFVFYLWLGAWGARNFNVIQSFLARIPMAALIALSVFAGLAAAWESHLLAALGSLDVMDTLRISNQIYSVAVVLVIVKIRSAVSPRALDIRASTFGIYLTHSIIVALLSKIPSQAVLSVFPTQFWGVTEALAICLSLAGFVVTYGCSLFLTTWLLNRQSLSWMVGCPATKKAAIAKAKPAAAHEPEVSPSPAPSLGFVPRLRT